MELRPYQNEAVDAVMESWQHYDKALLVLPTGTGKTIVFSNIAKRCVEGGDRVLILAHRGELLEQAADKLKSSTGIDSALEKAGSTAEGSFFPVTVGSVQTLQNKKRLERFPKDYYQVIIIDEAHHALSNSYQNVINYFENAKVLGVTATPDRGDMKNLGEVFENLAYEYSLPQAIRDGYLCRIKAQTIPIDIEIGNVKMSQGDYQAGDLGTALDPYLEEIARQLPKYCWDRKTVIFLPLVSTSQKMCQLINEQEGMSACEVNGNSSDRADVLADFEAGKYNVICNSMLLTEGWDCPVVDCVIVLRPTKVRSLYCQMIGRGTRLYPGKDHVLLLDFMWHTSRMDLCRPACLVGKNQNEIDAAMKVIDAGAEPVDIDEAMEKGAEDAKRQREEAAAKLLEENRKKKAKMIDVMQYIYSIDASDLEDYEPAFGWEAEPPSEKQLSTLERCGINAESIPNKGYATKLLDRVFNRIDAGLSTPKQIKILERYGFRNVADWTKEGASKLMGIIAKNRWMVPSWIDRNTYNPDPKKAEEEIEVINWDE